MYFYPFGIIEPIDENHIVTNIGYSVYALYQKTSNSSANTSAKPLAEPKHFKYVIPNTWFIKRMIDSEAGSNAAIE
jgi:hypothetical protein